MALTVSPPGAQPTRGKTGGWAAAANVRGRVRLHPHISLDHPARVDLVRLLAGRSTADGRTNLDRAHEYFFRVLLLRGSCSPPLLVTVHGRTVSGAAVHLNTTCRH